tara:strand:+ start:609 stop:893 length:285 start_codon:yes stop_codon:yes gene_type:complete
MENENNNSSNDWKERELGALWKKTGKSQNYFSGKIKLEKFKDVDSINIVGFSNKNKKDKANAPDVILYYSAPVDSLSLDSNKKEANSEDETPEL